MYRRRASKWLPRSICPSCVAVRWQLYADGSETYCRLAYIGIRVRHVPFWLGCDTASLFHPVMLTTLRTLLSCVTIGNFA